MTTTLRTSWLLLPTLLLACASNPSDSGADPGLDSGASPPGGSDAASGDARDAASGDSGADSGAPHADAAPSDTHGAADVADAAASDSGRAPDAETGGATDSPWVPSGYSLVFGDEFDGAALDTTKWWTRYVYSDGMLDRLNDEQEHYRENKNHVMTGTTLKLMGYKTGSDPSGINYESGMIRSKTIVKYGYLEARVKMPPGVGSWPAFWLGAEQSPWPPEIDIFEFVNNGVEDKADMLHTGVVDHGAQGSAFLYNDPDFHTDWTYYKAPYEFPADFHVVALLWDATTATTYVDGKRLVERGYKWVHDDGSDAGYAHVLLNYAIGGASWAGRHGVDDAAFPQGLEVDYVRVYQKTVDVGHSTIGHDLCPVGGGC